MQLISGLAAQFMEAKTCLIPCSLQAGFVPRCKLLMSFRIYFMSETSKVSDDLLLDSNPI